MGAPPGAFSKHQLASVTQIVQNAYSQLHILMAGARSKFAAHRQDTDSWDARASEPFIINL